MQDDETDVPVVLVYGTNGRSATDWATLRPVLEGAGRDVRAFDWRRRPQRSDGKDLTPGHAAELAAFLAGLARETGCRTVDVVAHSWGAVLVEHVVREVLDEAAVTPVPAVRALVGLAPTYAGTTAWGLARHHDRVPRRARTWLDAKVPTWREQLAGSSTLRRLHDAPARSVRRTTIVTRWDQVVRPYAASLAVFPDAENLVLQVHDPGAQVGHVGLLHHRSALDLVLAALGAVGPRSAQGPGVASARGPRASLADGSDSSRVVSC